MEIGKDIKQDKFKSIHEKAMINLSYTGSWLRDLQNALFRQYDILPQHYNILRILNGKHPLPVCPGAIKEVMLEKGNDVTRLLDKLVAMGLVTRKLSEENRRMMDVNLTEKGLKFLKDMEQPVKQHYVEIKKRLSDEEADQLSKLLDKLRG